MSCLTTRSCTRTRRSRAVTLPPTALTHRGARRREALAVERVVVPVVREMTRRGLVRGLLPVILDLRAPEAHALCKLPLALPRPAHPGSGGKALAKAFGSRCRRDQWGGAAGCDEGAAWAGLACVRWPEHASRESGGPRPSSGARATPSDTTSQSRATEAGPPKARGGSGREAPTCGGLRKSSASRGTALLWACVLGPACPPAHPRENSMSPSRAAPRCPGIRPRPRSPAPEGGDGRANGSRSVNETKPRVEGTFPFGWAPERARQGEKARLGWGLS